MDDRTDKTENAGPGTTDDLRGYLDKRGITEEQMGEARRRTRELLEQGIRQTDADVAIGILSGRVMEKLNEIRAAEHAEVRDREREDELVGQLNGLLLVRHKVYMGNEQAIQEALGMAGGTDETGEEENASVE